MHRRIIVPLPALVLLALGGCEGEGGPGTPPATQAEISELVAGNKDFAFDLYRAVGSGGENIICSPYSVSTALAMTYAGARNQTETQMAQTLNFTLPQARLHPAFKALQLDLASRGSGAGGGEGDGFTLRVANSLWGQAGYPFLQEFLDVLLANYGAGMNLVDFVNAPEDARLTINQWVSDRTEGRIPELIPPGLVDPWTRLVLANAIYFRARWAVPFGEELTHEATFHLLDGGEVAVQMMCQEYEYEYMQGDGFAAVELPYDGGEVSMVVFLPDAGRFEEFENGLDAARVDAALAQLAVGDRVVLSMPKFSFRSALGLRDALSSMGMPDAFSASAADFTGMSPIPELFLREVQHESTISVDERGTEATGATAVLITCGVTFHFTADRPFIFLVRDTETGTILFLGRVLNPAL